MARNPTTGEEMSSIAYNNGTTVPANSGAIDISKFKDQSIGMPNKPVVPAKPVDTTNTTNTQNTNTNSPTGITQDQLNTFITNFKASQTNSNNPSSSSTLPINNQVGSAVTGAVNGPKDEKPPLTDAQKWYMSTQGWTEEDVRDTNARKEIGAGWFNEQQRRENDQSAKDSEAKRQSALDRQMSDDLAAKDREWAAYQQKIETQRAGTLAMAKAGEAAANPYAASTSVGFGGEKNINATYDTLHKNMYDTYTAAQQAIRNGNAAAGEQLMASLNDQLAKNNTTLSSQLNQGRQGTQFNQTFQQNEQIKNQTLADKELQTITENTANNILALPDNASQLTPDQEAVLTGTPGYNALIQSGMSKNDAMAYVKNAATSNKQILADKKLVMQNANLAISLQLKQASLLEKQAALADAQLISSTAPEYQSAFNLASAAGGTINKETYQTNLSTLSSFIASGDMKSAKDLIVNYALSRGSATDIRFYSTLKGMPMLVDEIKTKVAALPASQRSGLLNGTYQQVAARLGQNPNPDLQRLGAELGHLQKNYITGAYGMRAASASGDSIFSGLFPNIRENQSLQFSTLEGLANTAKDTINSQIASRIGSEAYNKIFGTAGVFNSSNAPSLNISSGVQSILDKYGVTVK